jgi:hypothetical protein
MCCPSLVKYNVVLKLSMANEQEVRSKAQSAGLNQSQQEQAVQVARDNPSYTVDQVIQQVRNK